MNQFVSIKRCGTRTLLKAVSHLRTEAWIASPRGEQRVIVSVWFWHQGMLLDPHLLCLALYQIVLHFFSFALLQCTLKAGREQGR